MLWSHYPYSLCDGEGSQIGASLVLWWTRFSEWSRWSELTLLNWPHYLSETGEAPVNLGQRGGLFGTWFGTRWLIRRGFIMTCQNSARVKKFPYSGWSWESFWSFHTSLSECFYKLNWRHDPFPVDRLQPLLCYKILRRVVRSNWGSSINHADIEGGGVLPKVHITKRLDLLLYVSVH